MSAVKLEPILDPADAADEEIDALIVGAGFRGRRLARLRAGQDVAFRRARDGERGGPAMSRLSGRCDALVDRPPLLAALGTCRGLQKMTRMKLAGPLYYSGSTVIAAIDIGGSK